MEKKSFLKQFFDIRFWKFILVGIINTIVGLGANLLFLNVFHCSVFFSSLMDVVIGSIVSYILNRFFTFQSKAKTGKTLWRFVLDIAVCWVLCKWLLVEYVAFPAIHAVFPSWSTDLVNTISTLIGAGFFMLMNYVGQRFFVFRGSDKEDSGENTENTEQTDTATESDCNEESSMRTF